MKRLELFFIAILVPIDFIMLFIASSSAYALRYTNFFVNIRPISFNLAFSEYLKIVLPIAVVWVIIMAFFGLYSTKRKEKYLNDFIKIVGACSLGLSAVTFIIFFSRELFSSRFIVLVAWFFAIFFVAIGRFIFYLLKRNLLRKGIGIKRIVIVGQDEVCKSFCKRVNNTEIIGYKIIANFKTINKTNLKQLLDLINKREVDEIIQVDSILDKQITELILGISDEHHVPFKYAADMFSMQTSRFEVNTIGGIPFVEFKKTVLEGWRQIYKRIFDLIGSLVGIIIFSPIMAIIAIVIKTDSKGNIIYKNKRVSKEKEFYVYKFRTMKIEFCTGDQYDKTGKAEEIENSLILEKDSRQGPVYKVLDDPRRTRFGLFLEKTSLDELPQFFNVFIGNMSLVGPRPHQPKEVEKYKKHHKQVLAIKPGITGIAQVSGRSDLSFEEEVRLDTFYIKNWSLWMDLAIIIKTPFVVLFKKHKN